MAQGGQGFRTKKQPLRCGACGHQDGDRRNWLTKATVCIAQGDGWGYDQIQVRQGFWRDCIGQEQVYNRSKDDVVYGSGGGAPPKLPPISRIRGSDPMLPNEVNDGTLFNHAIVDGLKKQRQEYAKVIVLVLDPLAHLGCVCVFHTHLCVPASR